MDSVSLGLRRTRWRARLWSTTTRKVRYGSRAYAAGRTDLGREILVGGETSSSATSSSIGRVTRLVAEEGVTCEEVANAQLQQIHKLEPRLRSFMPNPLAGGASVSERVLEEARGLDRRLKSLTAAERRTRFPLAGVCLAVKDNICVKGWKATAGSMSLSDYVPPQDATVVEALKRKGCLVVGKTLCDEFGMGSTTESSASQGDGRAHAQGQEPWSTRNPWDVLRVPGGSSGGSAAAVSARQCTVALGTDTGGSVRQPASFCGVVGLKPTYGRVSRFGIIAYASSLDVPGCMGPTVSDCAAMLDHIAGQDPLDASSAATPLPPSLPAGYLHQATEGGEGARPLEGLRVGVVAQTMQEDGRLDDRVLGVMNDSLDKLRELGCVVEMVDVPTFDLGLPAYYITAASEASSNLSRYDGLRYPNKGGDSSQSKALDASLMEAISGNRGHLLGDEPLRRILMGTYTLSEGYGDALYKKAQVVRKKVQGDMLAQLGKHDVLLTPTAPTPAYRADDKSLLDPLQMYLGDVMTVNVNLAGFPAISVPAGLVDDQDGGGKLPVGVQFIGGPFEEAKILRVAHFFERSAKIDTVPPMCLES
ncbi:subunit A of glutamyl-tRNA(Gln) amidotransferase [Chloropicon primus]|uniref:Glutamyl-tRNA(Gln) amidotransferase subunit A, chloroplastic/mitochondrial n=1 Tax=Chloropicon primus TaxID=1764295 RepID=A0A5B8MKT9_9CHLO|nr:subunit A of glutamyl-tRNA(Gln) amidotransferase [Chloropicon primus]|eukprot:QDZ21009.1 subunit A of glutamyl-tRNA(Gln) amidotransferase [Chloropicon primus]